MTSLLLMRHAKSAWPPDVADRDRPLARRGERACQLIGRFLAKNALQPDAVLASPALRARETARLVLRAAGCLVPVTTDERIYDDEVTSVLEPWTDGTGTVTAPAGVPPADRVLVVGHEPGIMAAVAALSGAVVALPTATLVWLEQPAAVGEPATVRLVLPPRMLERWADG